MKYIVILFICLGIFAGCNKQTDLVKQTPSAKDKLREILKSEMNASTLALLNFKKAVGNRLPNGQTIYRIPFYGSDLLKDFIIIQLSKNGSFLKGSIVQLNGEIKDMQFNGFVESKTLRGRELFHFAIREGQFLSGPGSVTLDGIESQGSMADPSQTLPEVIVVSTYSNGGYNFATWVSLLSFFDSDNGSSYSGVYGYGGGGGGGTSASGSGSESGDNNPPYPATGGPDGSYTWLEEPLIIDFEDQYNDPAINLTKYLNCFAQIPDVGATASIEIFTDIPVDGDPTKLFDWSNGSPGHTFIQLRKENGAQFVSQNIGFYPKTGWKTTLTSAPLDSKFVDNENHEFNASYKVSLSITELNRAISAIRANANQRYSIDNYNCTTWALQVFNGSVHPSKALSIPLYTLPGSTSTSGSMTPQGVYVKLQQMAEQGGAAAAGVTVPLIGIVGSSHGPCN